MGNNMKIRMKPSRQKASIIGPYSPWPRAVHHRQAERVLAAGSVTALALLLRHIFPLA